MSKKSELQCDVVRIHGMTCTSCEVLIERKFKELPGVRHVKVNHASGKCRIYSEPNTTLRISELQKPIEEHGYRIGLWHAQNDNALSGSPSPQQRTTLGELGVIFLLIFAVYTLLKTFGVFSFSQNLESSFSFGAVFVIGLVAATSTCIAVVGGLILSLSGKMQEINPDATTWQKFRVHLLFNIGRLISYFVLGGIIGMIGKAITPSPRFTGILTIAIAIIMILLGIDILNLVRTKRFIPRMPKFISHKLHAMVESKNPATPFLLGVLTFFLPCGFTQSMQLYALTTGSFWQGAMTMLVFALGTLPALLGIGMMSSFTRGNIARYFLKFSGALVLVLGFYNFNNGLSLAGVSTSNIFNRETTTAASQNTAAEIVNGKQIARMAVQGLDYLPDTITVRKDMPVEWRIDGSRAQGCAGVITIPKLGMKKFLTPDVETVVTFTPTEKGTLPFTCSMGMAGGKFIVTD